LIGRLTDTCISNRIRGGKTMPKFRNEKEFKINRPCDQSWDEMKGNDKVRVCEHCEKEVNNLSAMTRKEALRLVRRSGGNICLRYYQDPKTQRPIFIERMQKLAAQSGVSAGVLTASVAFSGAAYAQNRSIPLNEISISRVNQGGDFDPIDKEKDVEIRTDEIGSVTGVVTDPNGAVIPYALVSLFNETTGVYLTATANLEGYYEFKDVPAGVYKMKFEAGNFAPREYSTVTVYETGMVREDAQLALQQVGEVVQVGVTVETQETVTVGSVSVVPSSPLVQAALNNDLEDVKARLMMRAKVNVRDKAYDGISPLHAAVENGNIEMVQFLLDRGAKKNIRDFQKRKPLMMMDSDATPDLLQLMIRYGAKTTLIDKQGSTLLMHFAENNQPEILRYLLSSGIPINAKNKDGETALMIAADNDQVETVKALLEAGADANLADNESETAMEKTSNAEIKSLLVTYGAVAKSN